MRNFKLLTLLLGLFILGSCSSPKVDDELSGHLLMGPYTTTNVSGSRMNEALNILADASDEEKIEGYKQIFGHPYAREYEQQAKATLLQDYNITDETTTKSGIEKLLENAKEMDYKAIEYAKAVNVANFAYSAGYISLEDTKQYEQQVLKEARANYSDWETYLNDFLEGRAMDQLANQDYQEVFETNVNEILLKNENSPYKHVGL
ncbi:DUF1266 domain-containing protein [Flavobacteriaceae bacterium Ap0902]|nr:DUF1266 domain-containing protein [Flavobacteriaceae bacterium Ap0902]